MRTFINDIGLFIDLMLATRSGKDSCYKVSRKIDHKKQGNFFTKIRTSAASPVISGLSYQERGTKGAIGAVACSAK